MRSTLKINILHFVTPMSYVCHSFVILLTNVFKSSNRRLDLFKIIFMKKIFTLVVLLTSFLFSPIVQAQCTLNVVSTSNVSCFGWNDGNITTNIANSTSYNLMPGNINNASGIFNGLSAGTYTITGTDNTLCTSSTITTIYQPTVLVITSVNFTNLTCFGSNDGQIAVTAIGGSGIHTFSITPLGPQTNTTGNFNNLSAQSYTITVTDANNCTSSTSVTITQPASLNLTTTITNLPACNNPCGGTGFVQANGGIPPYTYSINPFASIAFNGSISGLCANSSYTIVATDANGCTSASFLSVAGSTQLFQYTSVNGTSCGPTTCDATVTPQAFGTAPYTCNLTDGNLVNITQGLAPFNNICNGTYTLTITDANNCMTDTVFTITTSAFNNSIHPNTITSAGSITATPSGGTSPYQFSLNGSPFSTTNTFNMLCSGTYTLTIKDSYGAGCLKDTIVTIQAVTAFPGGSVTPYIVNPTCSLSNNGMISLVVTPNNTYTYQWNNNQSTSYLNNIMAGTYSVQILNPANECVELSVPVNSVGINCGNISGNVYYDSSLNCIQEPFEDIIPGTMIIANPGNHITFTDAFGNYAYNQLPYGTYTVSHQNNINAFQTHCGNNSSAVLNAANPNQVVNFGDSLKLAFDYSLLINSMGCFVIPNPVKVRNIYYYHNNPGYPSTGKVYAVFDSINHYVSSNPTHTNISGDTVFWNVTNITSNTQWIQVNFTFPNSYTAANTFPFTIGLSNLQYSDTNQLNNQINYTIPFCNSYDPNDKHVAPKGEGPNGNILASDLLLTYNINFQNTGNAPAYNIVIEDTLSDKLDITTFNVLQTSHPYQLEVVNNQIIKWKFYNIMLPDSTTNEPASHGQIHYQIRQKNGNQIGDVIKNKAYIYFDYNPPIITNETVNTIYQPTRIKNTTAIRNLVVIYPNPASTEVYIDAEQAFSEITLFNQQMSIVNSQSFASTKSKKVDISSLSNGIYFIKTNNGEMKKLVVQH